MAQVVTYWQLPEDEDRFLRFLESTGNIFAIADAWVETRKELDPRPIRDYLREHNPRQMFFGFADDVSNGIESRLFDGHPRVGVASMTACVIGYARGQERNGSLCLSNISAYWEHPDENASQMIRKSPSFVTWGKKTMSWLRANTPCRLECNGYPYRATKGAEDAVNNGLIGLALY